MDLAPKLEVPLEKAKSRKRKGLLSQEEALLEKRTSVPMRSKTRSRARSVSKEPKPEFSPSLTSPNMDQLPERCRCECKNPYLAKLDRSLEALPKKILAGLEPICLFWG